MVRRKHPQPKEIRAHLMDSALRAFAARGYESTTIRHIAEEAKVAAGLLYHYFPSKQAVLMALFERSAGLVMAAFAEVATIADPREKLTQLLRESARLVRENREFWQVSYGVRFQHSVLAGLAHDVAAQSAVYVQLFTLLLSDLGRPHPELEARLLFATLDGVFQHYVLDPETYPLDALLERVIDNLTLPTEKEIP
ncbi:MAG: TetR/AcrR family transcriptional regulator [Polyangiaceae bacterium]|nr:TetR/AcrR family transcriptional regulator [Polyangiaceae bacterium]